MRITKLLNILQWLVLGVVAGGLTSCSSEPKRPDRQPETVHNVAVSTIHTANVPDWVEGTGTVRAAQTSELAAQMMGNIVEMRVREGDRVQRGQVLAVIDDAQPRATMERATAASAAAQQEVAATESDYSLADSTSKRYQSLFDKKSVSPQEFDEVKARRQAALARRDMATAGQEEAKAALTQARTSLEHSRIRAPFDGVISEKKVDSGTLVSPGMPIFTIEDTRRYRLEATVDESNIQLVRIGQAVAVVLDALGNGALQGKVADIVPAADPASRSFLVKVDLAFDKRLRSGLFGRLQFPRGERTSLLVPRTALVQRGQLQGVYVVSANKTADLRYVTLGKVLDQQVEVLSGLENGETLVVSPGALELGGKRIETQ
jgi:RND family efflux transporter MFP subunit